MLLGDDASVMPFQIQIGRLPLRWPAEGVIPYFVAPDSIRRGRVCGYESQYLVLWLQDEEPWPGTWLAHFGEHSVSFLLLS